jgi:hypothetical protein
MGICDRILVMRQGEIGGRFEAGGYDREQLLKAALPPSVYRSAEWAPDRQARALTERLEGSRGA